MAQSPQLNEYHQKILNACTFLFNDVLDETMRKRIDSFVANDLPVIPGFGEKPESFATIPVALKINTFIMLFATLHVHTPTLLDIQDQPVGEVSDAEIDEFVNAFVSAAETYIQTTTAKIEDVDSLPHKAQALMRDVLKSIGDTDAEKKNRLYRYCYLFQNVLLDVDALRKKVQ